MSALLIAYLAGAACAFVSMAAHYAWGWRRYPAARDVDPLGDLLLVFFAGSAFWPLLVVFGASVAVGVLLADRRNGAP